MSQRQFIRLALPEGDALPTEFCLFTAGKVVTSKGVFTFDREAAKLVLAGIEERKTELMVDYAHASLDPKPLDPERAGRAAGWHDAELRDGALWATNVRWTDSAAAGLRAKEWRYYSPAFNTDAKTGRITEYINCALTNIPATHDLEPLIAAAENTMADEKKNDEDLAKALETNKDLAKKNSALEEELKATKAKLAKAEDKGDEEYLEDDDGEESDEPKVAKKAAKKAAKATKAEDDKGDEDEDKPAEATKTSRLVAAARKITGRRDLSEVEGALLALAQSHESVKTLARRVAELEGQRTHTEVVGLVDEAVRAGKVTPAKRDEFIQLGRDNRAALDVTLSMLTPIAGAASLREPAFDAKTIVLSRDDEEVIVANGLDREKFIAARKRQLERGVAR